MSEIEKLYQNAGIEKEYGYIGHYPETDEKGIIKPPYYLPFTAEKQIELIKWLSNNDKDKNKELTLYNSIHPYYYFGLMHEPAHSEDDMWGYGEGLGTTFEEGLAGLINSLWQDLTEEERKQIKEILE